MAKVLMVLSAILAVVTLVLIGLGHIRWAMATIVVSLACGIPWSPVKGVADEERSGADVREFARTVYGFLFLLLCWATGTLRKLQKSEERWRYRNRKKK